MYDKLKDIFTNVNEWLKFAEAKHAGLIVLNSGTIFGLLTMQSSLSGWVLIFSILFVGASLYTSFASMFPLTLKGIEDKKDFDQINVYFSGDLARLGKEDLKVILRKQMNVNHVFDGMEEDLIQQIIINARVAARKYFLFKVSLILLMIALVPLFVFVGYSNLIQ
jgi:hypothetical protein